MPDEIPAVPHPQADTRRQLKDAIVEHSEAMLAGARQGHWDRVLELAQIRKGLLQAYFSEQPVTDPQLARELLDADETVAELAIAGRRETCDELEVHMRGKAAVASYTP